MVAPLAIAVLFLSLSAPASADGTAHQPPEYYTLALTWHPTLCLRFPENPECAADQPRAALVLHGLWPERRGDPGHAFAFCGVDRETIAKDKPQTWCGLPPVPMYPETGEALDAVMPGRRVCLDRHEWFRHGSCSGLGPDAYFAAAHDLAQRYLKSEFARYLEDNAGRAVKREDVAAEFERHFGSGSRASMNLFCRAVGGTEYFNEIAVYLAVPLKAEEPQLSTPERDYQYSNCPAEFKIPFPRR
jgi:ribonuclease T2